MSSDEKTISRGAWVYMPAHLQHAIKAESDLQDWLLAGRLDRSSEPAIVASCTPQTCYWHNPHLPSKMIRSDTLT